MLHAVATARNSIFIFPLKQLRKSIVHVMQFRFKTSEWLRARAALHGAQRRNYRERRNAPDEVPALCAVKRRPRAQPFARFKPELHDVNKGFSQLL